MTDNPLFSVLIASYNNGKYLQEAIDSIYAQTYTNWEIILVDDASTDNSLDLYKDLKNDDRIHIFYNNKNQGCGYTKRRCIELANGELCGFLDADDRLLPSALELHQKTHRKHNNVSCVFSRFHYCDENMIVKGDIRLLTFNKGSNYFTNKDYLPEHFASFKKSLYKKTEGISADLKLGIDQDLYFKLEEVAPIFVLNEFTYLYRIHNNNISRKENAIYWNLIVRHRTCMRRCLDPTDYPIYDFINYGKYKFREGEKYNCLSYSYKLGHFLLQPFRILRKIFKAKK